MGSQQRDTYCVIGAGAAGLAAAKNLKDAGIRVVVFEREDDIGGNWYFGKPYSSIYESVHLISSKRFTEYPDFPMPDEYPTYIHQRQAIEYLRSYAHTFRLYDLIEFEQTVRSVTPVEGGRAWDVTLASGDTRRFAGVVIANGHLWDANVPAYPGRFDGMTVHSSKYKTPDLLRGKRVLVVGAGNSGCDIAVESAHHASQTFHSTRRGYYYWPKYLFGKPSDQWAEIPLALRMPLWMRRFFGRLMLPLFTAGTSQDYGLPQPDHKLFEAHYIINSTLFYHLGHGDITPKPDVRELQGHHVLFADGSREQVDVIVYATGFKVSFPFIDRAHLNWKEGRPELYLNIFHPDYDNLFVIGMFQTSTGNWPLFHYQSQLVASFVRAAADRRDTADWLRRRKREASPNVSGGIRFTRSGRHLLECEHYAYRAVLKKYTAKFRRARAAEEMDVPRDCETAAAPRVS
jgi:cation diffusion facilitator CzcD-associated flavoprotein CzcO